MTFTRQLVTSYEERDHLVCIRLARPDLIVEVDNKELGPFYSNVSAARAAATRAINDIEKAKR